MEELLTTDQAAKMLAISKTTLYRWVRSKRLNACWVGSRLRVRATDIERFVATCTTRHAR